MQTNSVDRIFSDALPQLTGSLDFFFTIGRQTEMTHEEIETNIKVFAEAQWMVEESRAEKISIERGLNNETHDELVRLLRKRHHGVWGIYRSPDSLELVKS